MTGAPRTPSPRTDVRGGLGLLAVLLLVGACASSSTAPVGGSDGSGSGGSNGSGGATVSDGGVIDGGPDSFPGSGGASSSGGSTSSGGASASGGSFGSGGTTGAGGRTGAAGASGTGTGGAGGGPGCVASIEAISPSTFTGIEAGPDAKLQMRGVITNASVLSPVWTWKVTANSTGKDVKTTSLNPPAGSLVEFPIPTSDTFVIKATVNDPTCAPPPMRVATSVLAPPGFLFRTTASGFPVQEQRIDLVAGAAVHIDLQSGRPYDIRPLKSDQASTLLSAYLRLKDPAANFSIEGDTTHGAIKANLLSGLVYTVLVVPQDGTVAPLLIRSTPENLQGFTVDQGLHVGALMLDSSDSPVVGARMILKSGELPSTVGTSDADGNLDLWARAGTVSAIVVPPDGSGLPQAMVDLSADGSGIVVPSNGSTLSLQMKWAAVGHGALTISVVGNDGATAVPNARVRVSLRGTSTAVGVLTASGSGTGDVNFPALGSVIADLVADTSGKARFATLPVGTYDVTVTPPADLDQAAITGASVAVAQAGASRTVTLARKVNLSGTLEPWPASQGASVTAIDKGSAGSGTTAIVGNNGTFTLALDPNRSYQLILQPRLGQALGRAVVANVTVAAGGTTLEAIMLPGSVSLTGLVMNGGNPIGNAFVQVFCVSSAASCVDPTVSLGDVTTLPDGSFNVVLPNLLPTM